MLEAKDLRVEFGGVAAIDGLSFAVGTGKVIGLIGPNGAGTSTYVGATTGVVRPAAGSVTWRGQRLSGQRPDQIARAGVARTFQHAHLFPGLTALENVMIGAHREGKTGVVGAMFRTPRWRRDETALRERAVSALDAVHALHLAERAAESLTAGQQRLVAVARALASRPELLFLDEPAAGLTDTERDQLAADLALWCESREVTVVLIEHNLGFLMSLVSEIVVLDRGRLLAQGTPSQIRSDPAVIAAYLGTNNAAS